MSGQATYLGSLTLGQCVPLAAILAADVSASAALALPQIQGKLEGAIKVQAALTLGGSPDLDGLIQAATALLVKLNELLHSGLPTIGLQLNLIVSLVAELTASLGAITAKIDFAAAVALILGTPGIEAYRYEGDAGSFVSVMSPEFTPGLRMGGGPSLPINAIVLVATDGGALAAMQKVFAI
jgi:hypothetical protein